MPTDPTDPWHPGPAERSGVPRCLPTSPFPKCSIQTRNSLSLQHIPEEEEEEGEEEKLMMKKKKKEKKKKQKNPQKSEERSRSGRSFSISFLITFFPTGLVCFLTGTRERGGRQEGGEWCGVGAEICCRERTEARAAGMWATFYISTHLLLQISQEERGKEAPNGL